MPAPRQRRVALASLIAFTLAALVAALPAGAVAKAPATGQPFDSTSGDPYGAAPPDNSAGDQYVETLPTPKGPRTPGKVKHVKKISAGLQKKLAQHGGPDAAALQALAATPSSGASGGTNGGGQDTGKGSVKGSVKGGSDGRQGDGKTTALPSAAINAVDGGEAGLGWLVVAILAITGLALGAAAYQRRRDKNSTG